MKIPTGTAAVVYLARGFDADHAARFARFVASYRAFPAGYPHRLYIIFKGFADEAAERAGEAVFGDIEFEAIATDDTSFDLGAYADALRTIVGDTVCFLNTNSEIASSNWLAKLLVNLDSPGVGMVSATGSYESLRYINRLFPEFPNPHLRSNAFAMRAEHARTLLGSYTITSKLDAFLAESGPDGLTQQIFALGLTCVIVGGDGRGYPPQLWPESETSRQGMQGNLLIHDNYTRLYETLTASRRQEAAAISWGRSVACRILGPEVASV